MKNLLKSDFYRLTISKSFYICSFVAALLYAFGIFILNWTVKMQASVGAEGFDIPSMYKDGISYGIGAFSSGDVHLFIAIFTAIFITAEFAHGTMKNVVSKGYSRIQIYLSKVITMAVATLVMILIMFVVGTLAATIVTGSFGDITGTLAIQMLKVVGIELLLHTTLTAIFVMTAMTIRNNGGVIAVNIIGIVSLSSLIYLALELLFKNKFEFSKYSLLKNIAFYNVNLTAAGEDFLRSALVAIVFFVIITVVGVFTFKKSDIK